MGKPWWDRVADLDSGAEQPTKAPSTANKGLLLAYADAATWHKVQSSNVAAVAYNEDFAYLFVEFKAKGKRPASLYVYHHVPRGVFDGFLAAPSKGQYVYYILRLKGTDSAYGYDQLY